MLAWQWSFVYSREKHNPLNSLQGLNSRSHLQVSFKQLLWSSKALFTSRSAKSWRQGLTVDALTPEQMAQPNVIVRSKDNKESGHVSNI